MAAVISLAQVKGGVGKSTTAAGLTLELAERGYQVRLVDADANHHSAEFGMGLPEDGNLSVVPKLNPDLAPGDHGQPQVNEQNLFAEIAAAEAVGVDVIIIDLPGVLSRVGLTAMMRSHLVIVPCRDSMMDARDAISTLSDIELARQSTGRHIEARGLMSAISPTIETSWERAIREQLTSNGLSMLNCAMVQREAFKDMLAAARHPAQISLDQYDPKRRKAKQIALSKAAENLAALGDEILGLLEALAEGKAA
jgi:chromosome partitioning protein